MRKLISTVAVFATLFVIIGCGSGSRTTVDENVEDNLSTVEDGVIPEDNIIDLEDDNITNVDEEVQEDNIIDKDDNITNADEEVQEDNTTNSDDNVTSDENTQSQTPAIITVVKVSGVVIDGPIYGATVKIVDVNDSSIVFATTTTDKDGSYSVDVDKLPKVYRVIISDGLDSGVDGVIDDNDKELPFDMSAMVERDETIVEDGVMPTEVANVSPATTVVDTIVESGAMPLDEARDAVAESFGVQEKTPLAKIDTSKHKLANQLANLIAFLAKLTPVEDKNIAIKSIANLVVKKEIRVKISDTDIDLNDLNLTAILDEAKNITPDDVSPEDIAKLDESQDVIKATLEDLITKVKVVSEITKDEQNDVLAQRMALFELIKEIQDLSIDELDNDTLKLITDNTQKTLKALLDDGDINEIDDDNVDFVTGMIKENLNIDIESLKLKVVKASFDYRVVIKKINKNGKLKSKISLKRMIKLIYRNSNINVIDSVSKSLEDDAVIDELSTLTDEIESKTIVEGGEIADELNDELIDLSAGEIAKEIGDQKTLKIEKIKDIKKNSINNTLLVDSIKTKVKIKVSIKIKAKTKRLSKSDNAQFISSKNVVKNIKMSVKIKVFSQDTKENSERLYGESINSLMSAVDDLKAKIKALEILLFDLNKNFNNDAFSESVYQTVKIIENIEQDEDADSVRSVMSIKSNIKIDYISEVTIFESIAKIEDNIDSYKEPVIRQKRSIILIQPSIKDIPTEFATPIKIEI